MKQFSRIKIISGSFLVIAVTNIAAVMANEPKDYANDAKQNKRETSAKTGTAPHQSNSPEDLKIAQIIRQALAKDGTLSMMAKKITAAGGHVTLLGFVRSAAEKLKIEALVKSVAGKATVENRMEIKPAEHGGHSNSNEQRQRGADQFQDFNERPARPRPHPTISVRE